MRPNKTSSRSTGWKPLSYRTSHDWVTAYFWTNHWRWFTVD